LDTPSHLMTSAAILKNGWMPLAKCQSSSNENC
jgi:hypothetical protein